MTEKPARIRDALLLWPAGLEARWASEARAAADAFGARLQVLVLTPVPDTARYGPMADTPFEQMRESAAAAGKDCVTALQELLGPSVSIGPVAADYPELSDTVATAARLAGLALLPPPRLFPNPILFDALLSACLDGASCPVLIVRGQVTRGGRHALIAWDGSRACSRAWRDARHLLEPGARVDVAFGGKVERNIANAFVEALKPDFQVELHEIAIHAMPFERKTASECLVALEHDLSPDFTIMGAGLGKTTPGMIADGAAPLFLSR